MKHAEPGFTLTEFLVYFFLLMLVTTLTVHWVASSHTRIAHNRTHTMTFIECSCAHDVLARDLQNAPTAMHHWKVFSDKEWVWQTPEGDVGWALDGGLLVRSHGFYSTGTHAWTKRVRSLVARGIKICSLVRMNANEQIACITSSLTSAAHHYTEKRTSLLRNRRIS